MIVCYQDNWEGHYRLMELLLVGALTITYPMHPLPLYLINRDSVVVYYNH